MSRAAALEFSFFLSIPTMFAASAFKLVQPLVKSTNDADAVVMTGHRWLVLGIGCIVSFLVAWGVVAWFMHWVRRHGFTPFAVYRILLGLIVLLWLRGAPMGVSAPPQMDSSAPSSYSVLK
jgi:undecaprenyl-diphosphatase